MDPVGGEFSFRLLAGNLGGLIFECVAEFLRRYGLKENHLCDFFYFGKNTFIVKILDGTLKEISYGVGTSLSQPIVIDDGDEEVVDDEDPVGDDEDAEEDEEDDGIMEVSEGEEENGVNRVLHPFDKVITKSDSKGDQTLSLPMMYVRNHVRPNWQHVVLQTPEGRTYACELKRRNPGEDDTPCNIGKDWNKFVKENKLKRGDTVHFRPDSVANNMIYVSIIRRKQR
ncbi:uncharacterized protein LOC130743421 isoform X2 [Lotus japonicus]|nr:uncharacterized protein LOC130743421 isoform X2 [Lotus japonicus]